MSKRVHRSPLPAPMRPGPAGPAQPPPAAPNAPEIGGWRAPTGELGVLLGWPCRWLVDLPAGWSMLCEASEHKRCFVITTSQRTYELARRIGRRVMHGDDWLACCEAAEQDRAMLALEQWLVPNFPPPRPPAPPDWTLPSQAIERLLGVPDFGASKRELTVAGVLEHFRTYALELDPTLDAESGLL